MSKGVEVKRFKNLEACFNEIKKFLKSTANPDTGRHHLETGRGFENFGGMKSREILGNWLLCAVLNEGEQNHERMKICTDPENGDGMIYDTKENKLNFMEHVMVSNWRSTKDNQVETNIEKLILEQINKKQNKGKSYGKGKTLVVFIHKPGSSWFPNRIQRQLPKEFNFSSLWLFNLKNEVDGVFTYNVAELNSNPSHIWEVIIDESMNKWDVKKIQ